MKFLTMCTMIAALALLGCSGGPGADSALADKLRLKDLQGKSIDLDDYRGKVVFINIWATWCKPCIQEMPSIVAAREALKGKNIEFLLASDEGKERIETFESKRKFGLPYVELEDLEALQIPALPQTYILNSKGDVVFSEAGSRNWNDPSNIDLLNKIIDE